jgi:membrane protease YdiL (CAAX protease family)
MILTAKDEGGQVPLWLQYVAILVASVLCQALRRRPMTELFGPASGASANALLVGLAAGATLMIGPAVVLATTGAVSWRPGEGGLPAIAPALGVLLLAAAIEELTFRGFIFQRLLTGIGEWPAQIVVAAMFVLTHSDALSSQGALGVLAGANIFLASIVFGLAYLRTGGLAMPFGLHLAANVTQGPLLGLGVSGDVEPGLLKPTFSGVPDWVTGGSFGLEASLPGLLCLAALTAALWWWRPSGDRAG